MKLLNNEISNEDILRTVEYDNDDIVFISGSLIEGHGNNKSDLDIFVVVDNKFDVKTANNVYKFGDVSVDFCKIKNIDCDIEYWKLDNLLNLIEQINNLDFKDEKKRVLNQIKINNIDFYTLTSFIHRFITSKNISGEKKSKQILNKLNVNNYFEIMMLSEINQIDNIYEDIIGNYEIEEYETALLLTRTALIKVLKVALFSLNVSLDRDKWAYHKVKKFSSRHNELAEIKSRFDYLTFTEVNDSNIKFTIEETIFFINDVIENSQKRRIINGV